MFAMTPKYRRAAIVIELGVSETWMDDGSESILVKLIEDLFATRNEIMHGMFLRTWIPGREGMDEEIAKLRKEYPLSGFLVDAEWLKVAREHWKHYLENVRDSGNYIAISHWEMNLIRIIPYLIGAEPLTELNNAELDNLGTALREHCSCPKEKALTFGDDGVAGRLFVRAGDDPGCLLHHPERG
jgi:hypothetical protein